MRERRKASIVPEITGKGVQLLFEMHAHEGLMRPAPIRAQRQNVVALPFVKLDGPHIVRGRFKLNLARALQLENGLHSAQETRPDAVILAAGTVGGILANDSRPVDFLYDNIAIAQNVVDSS
jgi:nucleoside-diphosphate-sugar epimerase